MASGVADVLSQTLSRDPIAVVIWVFFKMGAPESVQNNMCRSIQTQHHFPHLLSEGDLFLQSELFKACPVQFGALPAADEQFQSRLQIEPNFEALSWFFLKESHKIRTNSGV